MQVLLPPGWPRPKGYSNGVAARGRQVFIAGMVGWDEHGVFAGDDFASQARKALQNIVDVLREADGKPEHIVRMTWYVTDKREYLAGRRAIGQSFREIIGSYNAAMTAVEVTCADRGPRKGRDRSDRGDPRLIAAPLPQRALNAMAASAHLDTVRARPAAAAEAQPEFRFDLPELQFGERLQLRDRAARCRRRRWPRRPAAACARRRSLTGPMPTCSGQVDRIAHVLVADPRPRPGNRVLLRAANKPMLVACWFAVMKAGGIAVGTMPLLRAKELAQMIDRAGSAMRSATRRCAASSTRPRAEPDAARDAHLRRPRPRRARGADGAPRPAVRQRRHRRPTTPACSRSPPGPPACRRRRCTSTAT
jgi:enamine deaminase RidA (YjgF/YER057c/UK114 family)